MSGEEKKSTIAELESEDLDLRSKVAKVEGLLSEYQVRKEIFPSIEKLKEILAASDELKGAIDQARKRERRDFQIEGDRLREENIKLLQENNDLRRKYIDSLKYIEVATGREARG